MAASAVALLGLSACGVSAGAGADSGQSDATTFDNPGASFCASARCAAGTTCCEASRSCIAAGLVCGGESMDGGGPEVDVPTPNMCGGAICGAMQQCCMTRVGPTCLPRGVMCNPVMMGDGGGPRPMDGGGMGGLCGGAMCTAAQECCNAGGFQVCVPRGSCPGGGGMMCGRQTCMGTQICCSLTGPGGMMGMTCLTPDQCNRAGGNSDGGVADAGPGFCATANCAAGTFCCESQRACIPGNLTCRMGPPPMCRPGCSGGQVCCGNMCVPAGTCAMDPCANVTCGDGYSCCGTGRNAGTCTPAACLACCM